MYFVRYQDGLCALCALRQRMLFALRPAASEVFLRHHSPFYRLRCAAPCTLTPPQGLSPTVPCCRLHRPCVCHRSTLRPLSDSRLWPMWGGFPSPLPLGGAFEVPRPLFPLHGASLLRSPGSLGDRSHRLATVHCCQLCQLCGSVRHSVRPMLRGCSCRCHLHQLCSWTCPKMNDISHRHRHVCATTVAATLVLSPPMCMCARGCSSRCKAHGCCVCGFGCSVALVRAVLIAGSFTLWHQLQRRERAPQRACYCSPCVWHGGEPTLAHCGRRHN